MLLNGLSNVDFPSHSLAMTEAFSQAQRWEKAGLEDFAGIFGIGCGLGRSCLRCETFQGGGLGGSPREAGVLKTKRGDRSTLGLKRNPW